jgi:hypothetical protein
MVTAGSTRDARTAGIQQAPIPMTAMTSATAPNVAGS